MRAHCTLPFFISLLLSSMSYGADLHVPSRNPIYVHVSYPTPHKPLVDRSSFLSTLFEKLKTNTGLQPELVEPKLSEECRASTLCTVRAILPSAPEGLFLSVVVSSFGSGDDKVFAYLSEIEAVRRHLPLQASAEELLDLQLRLEGEEGVSLSLGEKYWASISPRETADSVTERLVQEYLRSHLIDNEEWMPFGDLILTSEPDATVLLDGRVLGRSGRTVTTIFGLRAGKHSVKVTKEGFYPLRQTIFTKAGESFALEMKLIPSSVSFGQKANRLTKYVGIGMITAGAVTLLAGAIHRANIEQSNVGTRLNTRTFYGSSYSQETGIDGGILLIPAGYSLLLGGGGMLGGILLGDEDDVPWISWLLGVGLGTASYCTSVIAAQ